MKQSDRNSSLQHIDHEAKYRYRPVIETYCTALRRVVSPYSDTTGDQYGFTQTILRVICSKSTKPFVENGQPLHGGCQGEHAKALVDRRENLCIRS